MKQRFSSLDVQVISHELHSSLISHRLSNIHDLSSRTFQFKFQSSAMQTRHVLVVDSGFRCHLTGFARTTASSPSGFVEKLRKCLKTRRVTAVRQVGADRIIEIQFGIVAAGDGEAAKDRIPGVGGYRLFFEFFASGNIILTDAALKIIALLRIVPEGPNQQKVAKGETYTLEDGRAFGAGKVTRERLLETLQAHVEKREKEVQKGDDGLKDWQKKKLKKTRKDDGVNRVLGASMPDFGTALVEHCLLSVGVEPDLKAAEALNDSAAVDSIFEAIQLAEKTLAEITSVKEVTGWIIAKKPTPKSDKPDAADKKVSKKKKKVAFGDADAKAAEEDLDAILDEEAIPQTDASGFIYDDFHPFLPIQFTDKPNVHTIPVTSYNKTVDSFFSSIESQKMEQRTAEKKAQAAKRLANARSEHKSKIESLHQAQDLHVRKAQAIEANIARVEEAVDAVNGLIAQGMDWGEIRSLIDRERKSGNVVAEMIMDVKFMENIVTIRLYEDDEESDDEDDESGASDSDDGDDEVPKRRSHLDIDIDLSLTGYANARTYYDQKRSAVVKETKTLQSSAKALKSTERKIQKDLKQAYKAEKMELRSFRRQGWWEKFYWFVSSEGYLVLGAKDPTQADMLYKKYFKRGDVWVHADVPGSCHVVVKNKVADMKAPVPPGTLGQAGSLAVASSDAWDKKQVISAWWAEYEQVGKMGAGGSVLGVGEFAVKGEKKWLPPAMLVMGFAVGWLMEGDDGSGNAEVEETVPEEAVEQQEDEEEEEEEEEFPDIKLESEGDASSSARDDIPPADDSDDEEFPDAKLDDLSTDSQQLSQEEQLEEEDTVHPLFDGRDIHPSLINRTAASSPSPSIASTATGTRHLSAKEKRDIKKAKAKGLSLPASALTTPNGSVPPIGRRQMKPPPAPRNLSSKLAHQQQVRGKKGKAKKIAEKYADQDDEDRALALKLLGNAKKDSDPADAEEREKAAENERLAKIREAEERQIRLKLQVEKMRAQVLAGEDARRETADRPLSFEEDLDEDALRMADLRRLVPEVRGSGAVQRVVDAIPICAPWSALQKFEWKVKLQPGTQKKGKAIREVVERWGKENTDKRPRKGEKGGEATEGAAVDELAEKVRRQKEMVRAWREAEIVQGVPVGKVKVMMPGLLEEKGQKGGGKGGGKKKGKK
ncbi:hypothetical protein Dda_3436 [Drechslerella dactyloides]|uniref:Ribosome quality control complex subunit 2 n=1 Tax=Drechslerella dactyloides TaxID=74499 RepID=A0AAD6J2Y7_DREDA|nr:hypothetical protein Dda_3436 [Drechslerella dactyloides]